VRDRALKQRAIFKLVSENGFESIEIRKFDSLFLQGGPTVIKPEASSGDKASG
jgi:hypothetical protein